MDKIKLISLSKVYFENNNSLQQIHVSEDGHFFYGEGQIIQYCKKTAKQRFLLTREEVMSSGKPKGKTNKEILQEKAKGLEIEGWEDLSVAKLKDAIDALELSDIKRKSLIEIVITLGLEGYEDLSDDELEVLIDKTKAYNDKRNALIEEAKVLQFSGYEDLSNEDFESEMSKFKNASTDLEIKKSRLADLEEIGDKRSDEEDDEYEDLVAELGD